MRSKRLFLPLIVLVLCCITVFGALCEGFHLSASDEWSWEPGSYDTFTGELDLSGYPGTNLMILMSADLPAEEETGKNPVFTVVDGKRITVLRQSNSAVFTPDENSSCFTFTGAIKLPVKTHIRKISFLFEICDENGQALDNITYVLSEGEDGTGRADGVFYLPFQSGMITIVLALAALLVWSFFLVIRRKVVKNNTNGD